MRIKHTFVREGDSYSRLALEGLFEIAGDQLQRIMQNLLEENVLKKRKTDSRKFTELQYSDLEARPSESGETMYSFNFVGVISVAGKVLKVLPKYIPTINTPDEITADELNTHLHLIFSVLMKYENSREKYLQSPNSIDMEKSFNLLPLILFLLNDYYNEGLYRNTREIIETNGSGEILWERTVTETCPLLVHGNLYYFDLKTKKRMNDEADYFRRLHSCILTCCYKDLVVSGLAKLFGLPEVYLCDDSLDVFGDTEFIKLRLQKELNVVFDSRRQMLLRKMYDYVDEKTSLIDDDCCTFYGTNAFNLVWEKVCSTIFRSQLHESLENLILPNKLQSDYSPSDKLEDIIDNPFWKKTGVMTDGVPAPTLKPDIVTITSPESSQNISMTHIRSYIDKDGEFKFLIFDAKYYSMTLDETHVSGQPGVGDVTKQYLYQVAFREFTAKSGIKHISNCFILPTYEKQVILTGEVYMKMLKALDLEPIKIRHIPVRDAYHCYLQDVAYPIDNLALDVAA